MVEKGGDCGGELGEGTRDDEGTLDDEGMSDRVSVDTGTWLEPETPKMCRGCWGWLGQV